MLKSRYIVRPYRLGFQEGRSALSNTVILLPEDWTPRERGVSGPHRGFGLQTDLEYLVPPSGPGTGQETLFHSGRPKLADLLANVDLIRQLQVMVSVSTNAALGHGAEIVEAFQQHPSL